MDYQALYRRYRPQTFDDVIGQSHVTATLAREVSEGHVAHAYLFAGPRGTGKTTTARILAKALNCENRRADGSPDNTCERCVAITDGHSLDVMELDAASHNSVDDIREMRVSVTTVASNPDARRVFILDEAHMLSKAAGNALLKTLEEPPPGVHFVLATTEPYKLLDTIRSRSQRFDFHSISVETLAAHLGRIGDEEGLRTEPAALVAVARHARGSARDALSLLEQVAALGKGSVEMGGVHRALGLADADAYRTLAEAIGEGDAKTGLELIARLSSEGADLRRFASEAIGFFRGVFLAHYAPNLAEVADEPGEVLSAWRDTAKHLSPSDTLRAVDVLGDALIKLREGREERLMLELAVIKLSRPETGSDPEALHARIDRLERRIAASGPTIATGSPPAASGRSVTAAPDTPSTAEGSGSPVAGVEVASKPDLHLVEPQPVESRPADEIDEAAEGEADRTDTDGDATVAATGARPEQPDPPARTGPPDEEASVTMAQFETIWPRLFEGLRDVLGSRRWALFRETRAGATSGSTLWVDVKYDFHLKSLQDDDVVRSVVATRAGDLLGLPVEVAFRLVGEPRPSTDTAGDSGLGASSRRGGDAKDHPEGVDGDEIDPERLLEAPPDVADPLRLVTDELGAKVVEEYDDEGTS